MWRLSKKHTHKQVHRLNPEGKYLGHEEGSFFFFLTEMVRYFSYHLTFSIYLVTQLSNSIHNNASTMLAEEVLRLVSISNFSLKDSKMLRKDYFLWSQTDVGKELFIWEGRDSLQTCLKL